MGRHEFEWKRGADFAELAEAVGIPTTLVLAAMRRDDRWTVLWSSDEVDPANTDAPVKTATLSRGADGILRLDTLPRTVGTVRDFLPPEGWRPI